MKVLITGRRGQLVQSLLARGRHVRDLQLVALGRPELDLESSDSIRRSVLAEAPELVINAAAYTAVDNAEDEPERAFRVNCDAAGELAATARQVGARIIQISTDYVFDGRSMEPYVEDAPTSPLGAYGRSKLAGEERVRSETDDYAIVRTAWVYSPYGRNFLKTMLALGESRDVVSVVSDQRGSPSCALDLADGLLAMVDRWRHIPEADQGKTYHLAGSGSASWSDFARHIFSECERLALPSADVRPIDTGSYPTKAARPMNSVLDSSKFERDFGYRAPYWKSSVTAVLEQLAGRETLR